MYQRDKISKAARKRLSRLVQCQHTPQAKRNAKRLGRKLAKIRRYWLAVTPYRCNGTRFAIPCYIVSCESSFQNLSPNSASASGYYQFIRSTWHSTGGGQYADEAYRASKAEQDIVAARLWSGGAGASHWDCA